MWPFGQLIFFVFITAHIMEVIEMKFKHNLTSLFDKNKIQKNMIDSEAINPIVSIIGWVSIANEASEKFINNDNDICVKTESN